MIRFCHSPAAPYSRLLAVVLVLLGLLAPRAAFAQQLIPLVPDPIATPELQPIAKALGLSDQQALQLLEVHDGYKERYAQFLDTDVRKLVDQVIEIGLRFQRGRFDIPERKELESLLEDFKRLLTKSQTIDRGFFTEIGTMLSDEQMPKLDRARINRELKVYREILGGVAEMNRGAGVNLAEMVNGLDLDPAEREQVEPILSEYESALLAKSHAVFNVLTDVAKVVLDFIDSLNIRGKDLEELAVMFQDPDAALLDRARSTFDDASKPIQEAAWDVSQLNLRTFKRIAPLLRPELVRDLRDRYYQRAYREVYPEEPKWLRRYHDALQTEGVSDELKQAIEEQRESFRAQDDSALAAGVEALEDSRKYKTFKQFSGEEPDPVKDKTDDCVARRKSIDETATTTLNGLLGETLVAQLDEKLKKDAEQGGRRNVRTVVAVGPGGAEMNVEVDADANVPLPPEFAVQNAKPTAADPYLPQPMGARDFERVLEGLGVPEGDRSVAMNVYDSYRSEFETARSNPLAVQQAGEEATFAETAKARQVRTDELAALDARLFDDLALLVSDAQRPALEAFRATRRRVASTEIAQGMGRFFGDEEAFIDLIALVNNGDLEPELRAAARTALGEYDARVAQNLTERLEAAREVLRRSEVMRLAGGHPMRGPGGGPGGQAAEFATEKWREARQRMSAANDKIIAVNREMLAHLTETLATDAAWQVRLAYNQTAYPEIYRDERSAEKAIQGALALPDLADHQREKISEVAADYRAAFFGLCDQMVALRRERGFNMFGGSMPKKEDIDREIELEKMRFARNELSARAKMRVSLILTDEQSKILPELQGG